MSALADYALPAGSQLPAFWLAEIQSMIAGMAPHMKLVQPANNKIRVLGTDSQMAVPVNGLWRYVNANADAVHPGGAAGSYDVVVAASGNVIASEPSAYTDNTDYNFYVYIEPTGSVPTGNTPNSQAIVATRKIGEVDWDGTNITGVRQRIGTDDAVAPATPTAPSATSYALRAVGATSQTADIMQVQNSTGTNLLRVSTVSATLSVPTTVSNTLSVTGALTASATGTGLSVTNNATVGGTLAVTSNTTVGGTLGVTGAVTLSGNASVAGTLSVTGTGTALSVTNSAYVGGAFSTGQYLGVGTSLSVGSTSTFTGLATFNGGLIFSGSNLQRRWNYRSITTSATANDGDFVNCSAALTVTLPTPNAGSAVIVRTSGSLVTITAGTATIYGPDVSNTSMTIGGVTAVGSNAQNGQYVQLIATAGGAWMITDTNAGIGVLVLNPLTSASGAVVHYQIAGSEYFYSGITSNGNWLVYDTVAGSNVVTSTSNSKTLSVTNALTVGTTLAVTGTSVMTGAVTIGGASAATTGGLYVYGASTFASAVSIYGNSSVTGSLQITANMTIGTTLGITGNTTVGGTLGVTGAITGTSMSLTGGGTALTVTNNISAGGVNVTNAVSVGGNLNANSTLTVVGTATFQGNTTVQPTSGSATVSIFGTSGNTATLSMGIAAVQWQQQISSGGNWSLYDNSGSGFTMMSSVLGSHSLTIAAAMTFNGALSVYDGINISSGSITFGSGATFQCNTAATFESTLTTYGNVSVNGGLTVGSNTTGITINGNSATSTITSNAASLAGTLSVGSSLTASGTLSVSSTSTFTGLATFNGGVSLSAGTPLSNRWNVVRYTSSGTYALVDGQFVSVETGSVILTLPTANYPGGAEIEVFNNSGNTTVVNTTSSQTINVYEGSGTTSGLTTLTIPSGGRVRFIMVNNTWSAQTDTSLLTTLSLSGTATVGGLLTATGGMTLGSNLQKRWNYRSTLSPATLNDGDFGLSNLTQTVTLPSLTSGGEVLVVNTGAIVTTFSGTILAEGSSVSTYTLYNKAGWARFVGTNAVWQLMGASTHPWAAYATGSSNTAGGGTGYLNQINFGNNPTNSNTWSGTLPTWTCPNSGWYHIEIQVSLLLAGSTQSSYLIFCATSSVNGSGALAGPILSSSGYVTPNASGQLSPVVSNDVYLTAGTVYAAYWYSNSTSDVLVNYASGTNNAGSVNRIAIRPIH